MSSRLNTRHIISEMTSTPAQREGLECLTDKQKLELILKLTDNETFVSILEYIQQAEEDAGYCFSYR